MGRERPLVTLEEIQHLMHEKCMMIDPGQVEVKINEFIKGGPERMQLVTDFDYTLTRTHTADGKVVPSSFGIFNACKSLPAHYVEETDRLFHKYRPIEIDPHMSKEEKMAHMVEWWSKSSDALKGFSFDESEIDQIVGRYKNALRDNTPELFHKLDRLGIPVLVFSAGLGNSVISILRQAGVMYPNVKVVSNFLLYKDGLLNGFQEPMIHTFNKNETVLDGHEYYDLVHTRDHIILMGDSIGDADMANGVPASSHIIKIGFLFHHVEENLDKYMKAFDIVLIEDQTMDVPCALFDLIEAHNGKSDNATATA